MKMAATITMKLLGCCIIGVFGESCTKNWDGTKITCETTFAGEHESITIDLDPCRKNPKITLRVVVGSLGIDFEESFYTSQDIPIPGLTVAGNGVYIGFEINVDIDGYTHLKITLSVKTFLGELTSQTLVDEPIAESSCNGFLKWWNTQNVGVKAAVAGGAALFLIILLVCCCKCCCCKKKKHHAGTTIIMAPLPHATAPHPNAIMANTPMMQQTHQNHTLYVPPMPASGNQYTHGPAPAVPVNSSVVDGHSSAM